MTRTMYDFLKKYEKLKREIRSREEFLDFVSDARTARILREIKVIEKAFEKTC